MSIFRAIATSLGMDVPEKRAKPSAVQITYSTPEGQTITETGVTRPTRRPPTHGHGRFDYPMIPNREAMSEEKQKVALFQMYARDLGVYNGPCDGEIGEATERAAEILRQKLAGY